MVIQLSYVFCYRNIAVIAQKQRSQNMWGQSKHEYKRLIFLSNEIVKMLTGTRMRFISEVTKLCKIIVCLMLHKLIAA